MKGVYSKSREEWVEDLLGPGHNLTERQMQRVLLRMTERGWITPFPAYGPAYELVAVIRETHPLAPTVRAYNGGTRLFERAAIEQAIDGPLNAITGAHRLAKAGFVVLRMSGSQVELHTMDPRAARMLNESRCQMQERGYGIQPVLAAFLSLQQPPKGSIKVTDMRRLQVEESLRKNWDIRCDDLLTSRRRVRFRSTWLIPANPAMATAI